MAEQSEHDTEGGIDSDFERDEIIGAQLERDHEEFQDGLHAFYALQEEGCSCGWCSD